MQRFFDDIECIRASTYTWQPGGLTGSSVVVSPSGTTTYTVTGTSAAGCTSVSDVTIVVHPLPTANAGADGTTTCSTPTMVIGTAR
ncbi:MAG: hypothetical protein HWD58_11020 [Bacteroidota bacterium]|nr:MAG: hypothetical protein HWD58_11020 [Bacteroidota bacterium]